MSEPKPQPSKSEESVGKTLLIALLVSLACSSLVASAAVLLKPYQIENQLLDIRRNILEVAGLLGTTEVKTTQEAKCLLFCWSIGIGRGEDGQFARRFRWIDNHGVLLLAGRRRLVECHLLLN